ncbi:MAG: hypothetical protein ACXVCZ_22165, partial [Bdellovibrionota bacterium]
SGFTGSRNSSWFAIIFGLASLIGSGYLGFLAFQNPLHDITTDLQTPPLFRRPVYAFPVGKGAEYLDESFRINRDYNPANAGVQMLQDPSFGPLTVKVPPTEAYVAVKKAIDTQLPDWHLVLDDPATFHLEYEVEDPIFRSIFDVVVEARKSIRSYDANSDLHVDTKVEARSRGRLNFSDFGWDMAILRDLKLRLGIALSKAEEDFAAKPPPAPPAKPAPPAATETTSPAEPEAEAPAATPPEAPKPAPPVAAKPAAPTGAAKAKKHK